MNDDVKQISYQSTGKITANTFRKDTKRHFSVDDTEHTATISLVKIVFVIILISVVFASLAGSLRTITFTGFLDWIKDFHPIFQNVTMTSNTIAGSWGLVDFMRVFFNMIITIFDFFVYLCKSLINIVSYITGFFAFLFSA